MICQSCPRAGETRADLRDGTDILSVRAHSLRTVDRLVVNRLLGKHRLQAASCPARRAAAAIGSIG